MLVSRDVINDTYGVQARCIEYSFVPVTYQEVSFTVVNNMYTFSTIQGSLSNNCYYYCIHQIVGQSSCIPD